MCSRRPRRRTDPRALKGHKLTATDTEVKNVHFEIDADGVATILMDVQGDEMNTLGDALGNDLFPLIERLETDPAIKAVVIGSAKPNNFLAGADIRWLRQIEDADLAVDRLAAAHAAFQRIEDLTTKHGKPVVAAIHGACLGGGLELALACSMRIASNDEKLTQLGQPEVKLGIIPGVGGTQRLPRLIGIAAGLDLILTGKSLRPSKALRFGLIDEAVPAEYLLEIAKKRAVAAIGQSAEVDGGFSVGKLKSWLSPAHLQELALEENPMGRKLLFAKAEEKLLAETKGNYPAPEAALRAVKAGVERGHDVGYATELEEFRHLVTSPEAKALMSIFFATQDLKKDSGTASNANPRPVTNVGVLGGGLMGGGIAAINTTKARVATRIKEIDQAGVGRGLGYVSKHLAGQVKRRRLRQRQADKALTMVTGSTDWSGFGNVDLIIEAVFEDLDLKRRLLAEVEGVVDPETIFASNTSSLPIADIAAKAKHPERVIGMHYFSPVEKMPLLEIITTNETADWVTATCVAFGKKQGKTVIVVNDGTGFYTSRVIAAYMNEVGYLLMEGVAIEAIDKAMVEWGFPVGPVTLTDEVGIDVGVKVGRIMQDAFGDRVQPAGGLDKLVADDRKGRKNGRGFYKYEDGKKTDVDESVYAVLGVTERTSMATEEIQERLALQFINEAAMCLEENILRNARDGDIGAIFGLGFPPFRGGPFSYVDREGAAAVVAKLEALAAEHGERFTPAAILTDYAKSGKQFRG
ncbi:MAG: fatty acid oxidation complex subunit alpha FadJ [Acidimicrobiia bacterium]|nr:fatty acid oxidation complex subunit alpha FadJ [Acidimicrobiia bacterium]